MGEKKPFMSEHMRMTLAMVLVVVSAPLVVPGPDKTWHPWLGWALFAVALGLSLATRILALFRK